MPSRPLVAILIAALALCAGCGEKPMPVAEVEQNEAPGPRSSKRTLRVLECSAIPDPKTADYADCLFVVTAEVTAPEKAVGQRLNVALWAFQNRTLMASALVLPGDKLTCRLVDYTTATDVANVRIVDDVGDLDLPTLYAEKYRSTSDTTGRVAETVERGEPEWDVAAQVKMIEHLRAKLSERGIHLLVVPFPFREAISADHVFANPEHARFVEQRRTMLGQLRELGVDLVELDPAFATASAAGAALYYPGDDHHPADAALQIAAGEVSKHLLSTNKIKKGTTTGWSTREIGFEKLPGFSATQVLDATGTPLACASASPLLVAGDSYARYPEQAPFGSVTSANFAAHLALQLATPVRQFSLSSGGAVMPRAFARRPELLEGTEVCVFLFAPYYPWVQGATMWETAEF